MKKLLLIAAAVAMPQDRRFSDRSMAVGEPPINISGASITCTSLAGLVKFAPPVKIGGSGISESMPVKLDVSGCTVSGSATPITIAGGRGAGTLHMQPPMRPRSSVRSRSVDS